MTEKKDSVSKSSQSARRTRMLGALTEVFVRGQRADDIRSAAEEQESKDAPDSNFDKLLKRIGDNAVDDAERHAAFFDQMDADAKPIVADDRRSDTESVKDVLRKVNADLAWVDERQVLDYPPDGPRVRRKKTRRQRKAPKRA